MGVCVATLEMVRLCAFEQNMGEKLVDGRWQMADGRVANWSVLPRPRTSRVMLREGGIVMVQFVREKPQ